MSELEKFKPYKPKDYLVKPIDYYDVHTTVIAIAGNERKNDATSYFEVIKCGHETSMAEVGSTVILGHLQHTPPFTLDGEHYAMVSEDDIWGVLDNG